MLRYRVALTPTGRYMAIAASTCSVSIQETYSTRIEAQDTADWLNQMQEKERREEPTRAPAL